MMCQLLIVTNVPLVGRGVWELSIPSTLFAVNLKLL
jgi:hypothetical protein